MKRNYDLKTIMLILVLFLSNIAIMGSGFYTVIMTQLYANYEEWVINMTMALPGMIGMFACLACGKICDKVNKKWLFVAGMALFTLTGTNLAGIAYNSGLLMIGAAAFSGGICYGMVSVSSIGLISDCFENEEQRSLVMGWYNGAMAMVGAILSFAYGMAATINWKLASAVNWSAILVVILAIVFVPSLPPKSTAGPETETQKVKGEKGWANRLIPLVLAFFLVSFAVMSVMTYVDLYITANQLGNASLTGLFGSVQQISSFIACTFFGVTYKKLGTRISIPCYLLLAVSILLMFLIPNKTVILLASAIMGASWGTVYTYWFFRATMVVPEHMVGTATGVITTANSLSYLPIPYVITGLMAAFRIEKFQGLFPLYIAIILAVFVGAIVLNGKKQQ